MYQEHPAELPESLKPMEPNKDCNCKKDINYKGKCCLACEVTGGCLCNTPNIISIGNMKSNNWGSHLDLGGEIFDFEGEIRREGKEKLTDFIKNVEQESYKRGLQETIKNSEHYEAGMYDAYKVIDERVEQARVQERALLREKIKFELDDIEKGGLSVGLERQSAGIIRRLRDILSTNE